MIGLIPAGGKATRIGGLPKFALPCNNENIPILKRHVDQMSKYCEKIVISTTSQWENLIKMFNLDIELMIMEPSTMNDALKEMAKKYPSPQYLVGMADTYFYGENPYDQLFQALDISVGFACWKIDNELKGRVGQVLISENKVIDIKDKVDNCSYEYMWGALLMNSLVIESLNNENTHPGIDLEKIIHKNNILNKAYIINGEYFDVGTISGYKKLINKLNL